MTLCPIALITGCKGCPFFSFCPLKNVIGDNKKPETPNDSKEKNDRKSSDQNEEK